MRFSCTHTYVESFCKVYFLLHVSQENLKTILGSTDTGEALQLKMNIAEPS